MNTKTFAAIVNEEKNIYVAQSLEVGTVSQGESLEEASVPTIYFKVMEFLNESFTFY